MKKTKKTAIIFAALLVAAGLFISFGALAALGFDFTKMNSIGFETNTYSVREDFTDIFVEGAECDVRLLPSDDGTCKVIGSESDKIYHSVTVENSTLTVKRHDGRKWYEHISVYWGKMEIAIYLPRSAYEALYVKNLSGEIVIPEGFSFTAADVQSTSGDIRFSAGVKNELSVKTVSGDIELANIQCQSITADTTSGEVEFSNVNADENIRIESVSGEVDCSNVLANGNIHIKSVSGDVELHKCDAETLWIKTTSGDVSGLLLTEKIFLTDTTSGDIDVPRSTSGGKCEIKTTSGDIEFDIK